MLAGSLMFLVLQIIIATILIVIGIRIYCSAKHTKNTTLAVHVAVPSTDNVPYEDVIPVEQRNTPIMAEHASSDDVQYENVIPVEQRNTPKMAEHVVLSSSDDIQYENVIPVEQRNTPIMKNAA